MGTHSLKPSDAAFKDAENRKIKEYYKINSLDEMLQCLNQGFPFVASFRLFTSFGESLDNGGVVRMPSGGEIPSGRHAVMICGYNKADQTFLCRNSWGLVQNAGYFTVPFDYMKYAEDCWTIRA